MPGGCLRMAVTDDDDDIVKAKQADRMVGESNFLEQQSEAACPVAHISSLPLIYFVHFKCNTLLQQSEIYIGNLCTVHLFT